MENQTINKRALLHQRILRVREGDQSAFAELLAEYTPLVSAEVSRHGATLGEQDVEDLRQIALLALYRAALGFDLLQSDVEFGLYAKICMANALVSQLRVIGRRRAETPLTDTLSCAQVDDPAARLMEEEALADLHKRIRAVLSPFELRVWTLYVAGYRSGEIARQLQKDTHSVENAVYRIRQKLRVALGDCI